MLNPVDKPDYYPPLKLKLEPGMMIHVRRVSTWEVEAIGSKIQSQLELQKAVSINK